MLQIQEPGQDKNRKVIGIDLGTTYSLVATANQGQVQFFDCHGTASLPSMVQYDNEGKATLGTDAKTALKSGANNVFYSMKRLMGKGINDVEDFKSHVSFNLTGTDEMVYAVSGDIKKSPIDVSADILKHLKFRAEATLGSNVYDAVITVPAYFNDAQRQATKDAAKLAGLNVMRLVSEPTAAALAYGLDKKAKGTFMVYDLGGGTFDVSLLKLTDGVFRVIATGGNTYLGGDDIDNEMAKQLNITALEARSIKENLCMGEAVENFTVDNMNAIAKPFIDKTLNICEDVLDDAEIDIDDLDGIVLVGGSTKMPLIHEMVEDYFDVKPEEGIDPDKVVVHGAALQAEALSGGNREAMLLLDVTPLSLGLETMGGLVEKVIHRNTPIPITKAQKFTTFKDGQNAMDIHVLQGERETVEGCRSLAKFRLKGIPQLPAGAARILVTFALDADGLLSVTAKEESTGVTQTVDVVPSYGISQSEILEMLKNSITNAKSDVEERQLQEVRLELERVIDACQSALTVDGELLEKNEKLKLEEALNIAKQELKAEDRDNVENAMEDLEKAFQSFSEERVNRALRQAIVGQKLNDKESA